MTRPIEQNRANWCTVKEATSLSGRGLRTVQRWIAIKKVRIWREPGGRLLLYLPDFMPPAHPTDRQAS